MRSTILFLIALSLILSACASATPTNSPQPTDQPAAAETPASTDSPASTDAPAPTESPTDVAATAEPTEIGAGLPDAIATLQADGRFTRFLTALEANGLLPIIQDGTFTLFAPTDAAFDAAALTSRGPVSPAQIAELLAAPETASALVGYHLAPGYFPLQTLLDEHLVITHNGQPALVYTLDGTTYINGARFAETDLEANNAIIHVIEGVLIARPYAPAGAGGSLMDILREDPRFSDFVALIDAANLADILTTNGPFTVFAPTNDALAGQTDTLLADPAAAEAFVKRHIAVSAFATDELATLSQILMTSSERYSLAGGMVGTAPLANETFQSSNGVIHILAAPIEPAP